MLRTRRTVGLAVTSSVLFFGFLTLRGQPAMSQGGCNDYEDWNEVDIGPDDPHHMWEGGDEPEQQEPQGEWDWVRDVEGRGGNSHGNLDDGWTVSGEHTHGQCSG
jgi:hypothetical protein